MDKFVTKIKKGGKKEETKAPEVETIPSFPKLYQLNNNHKIYEWSIRIEESHNGSYDVITAHGEKDSVKMVSHVKNIDAGKAGRSVLKQAILEAESKFKNKKEKDLYCETVEETEDNVGSNIIVRPMLANTFDPADYKKSGRGFKISFPAYAQKKFDGIRCISYRKDGNIIMESRKGIPFQNFGKLRGQMSILFDQLPSTMYLDGELYTDDVDFETLSGLVRLTEKKVTKDDLVKIDKVSYYIYDFIDVARPQLTYQERYEFLTTFLEKNKTQDLIVKVDSEILSTVDDVKKKHDEYVQQGYEGIMIREKTGIYEVQKRSKYLQKYKEFFEEEFKIIGYHEGTGDMKGCVIWDCQTKDGVVFTVVPKGTYDLKRQYYENGDKYINKIITVKFQEYTTSGAPRFGVGKAIRDIY